MVNCASFWVFHARLKLPSWTGRETELRFRTAISTAYQDKQRGGCCVFTHRQIIWICCAKQLEATVWLDCMETPKNHRSERCASGVPDKACTGSCQWMPEFLHRETQCALWSSVKRCSEREISGKGAIKCQESNSVTDTQEKVL